MDVEDFKKKYEQLKDNPMYKNFCSIMDTKSQVLERTAKENQELKKQCEIIFDEFINYMTKQDFAKRCNISRPYLDKLIKSGMTRNEIYNYCLVRNKLNEVD